MDIEVALYKYLSTYAGLTALVSTRIYPDDLPKDPTLPSVVFELDDDQRYEAMGQRPGISYAVYRFTCYGSTKTSAVSVGTQLKAALDYFCGTMGGAGGVEVEWAKFERAYDEDPENTIKGTGKHAKSQHARVLEFLINYRE